MTKSALALRLAMRFPTLAKGALWCWARVRLLSGKLPDRHEDHWLIAHLSESLGYRISVWTRLTNGMKIRVVWNDYIGREILRNGSYEPEILALLGRLLKSGMVFFDVGAHVGQYTLAASRWVGETGEVHSFEPDPQTYLWLSSNVRANHLKNVRVNQMALADKPGVRHFYFATGEDIGSNSLAKPNSLHDSGRSAEVTCTTVDEYKIQHRLPRIDLMKVDVEGAESLMLAGAQVLLQSIDAPLLLLEFEEERQKAFGNSCAALAAILSSYGYQLFRVDESLSEYPANAESFRSFNVLAVPPKKLSALEGLREMTSSPLAVSQAGEAR